MLERNPWHFPGCFHPTGVCPSGTSLTRSRVPIGVTGGFAAQRGHRTAEQAPQGMCNTQLENNLQAALIV